MLKSAKRRHVCLMLAALLLMASLTACAPSQGSSTPSAATSPPASASATKPADPTTPPEDKTFTISWTPYQMAPTPEDAPMVKYYEDMFNVDFDVWNIDHQQFAELLNVRLASGDIPDLMLISSPSDLPKYVSQGVLAPIPLEMLEQHMPNALAAYDKFYPGAIDLAKVDGQIYGIPAINSGNIFRLPIVYNQNWLDKLNLEVPTTIDEFEKVIYAFANDDPDGNGIKDTYGLSEDGLNLLYGMYNMVPEQDYFALKGDKIVYMPIEPEMKEALAYANKWYKDGVLDPEFITGENTGGYWAISHSFINQRVGMTVRGNYYHYVSEGDYSDVIDGKEIPAPNGAVAKELYALDPNAKISFGQPLINKDGKQGGIRGWNLLMRFYGIGADTPQEDGKMEKILEIMDYMSDANPDLDARMVARHGFENETWRWIDREKELFEKLPPYDENEAFRFENGSVFWWNSGEEQKSSQAQWGYKMGFDKGGIFSVMPIAVDAMTKYNAQLETLRKQAYIQIITGEKPLEYFDEFVAEYLKLGGQEILDQAQQWYDSTQK